MIDENTTCKLSVEIKKGRFIYNYDVGTSRGESSSTIDPDFLCSFTGLLKFCSSQTRRDGDVLMDGLKAKAWINENKKEAQEFLDKQITES